MYTAYSVNGVSFKRMPRVKLNKNNDQYNTLALVTGQSTHFD